jgi:hypothetical protein
MTAWRFSNPSPTSSSPFNSNSDQAELAKIANAMAQTQGFGEPQYDDATYEGQDMGMLQDLGIDTELMQAARDEVR